MNILVVSAFYHDSTACISSDGHIVAAAQKERFTCKKFDASFLINTIRYCLQEEGRSPAELHRTQKKSIGAVSLPQKIALAKLYIQNASFSSDLRLIANTVVQIVQFYKVH
jgi:predicted NodU family carbamoyl transferase